MKIKQIEVIKYITNEYLLALSENGDLFIWDWNNAKWVPFKGLPTQQEMVQHAYEQAMVNSAMRSASGGAPDLPVMK